MTTEPPETGRQDGKSRSPGKPDETAIDDLILFHPDYTVGSGITPDLLTLPLPTLP